MSNEKQNAEERTKELKSFVRNLGIDLVGVADLQRLEGMQAAFRSSTATRW